MGANTAIEWAHHTFNPWVGCTKVSPACDNCYAEAWAKRTGQSALWQGGRRFTSNANWHQPIKWNRKAGELGIRQRVFCASLADVFDNQVPDTWRFSLFAMIAETPNLDWLLLTKRPQNMRKMLEIADGDVLPAWGDGWPNVWLGTTVENQTEADRRIPQLLATRAAKRFLSCEPLLGPVDLGGVVLSRRTNACWKWLDDLDMVIAGGESGPNARPTHPDWVRGLRDQCVPAGVAFFFKQWGGWEVLIDRDRDDPDWRADYSRKYVDEGKSKWLNLAGGCGFHGERFHVMGRVGKKRAGRLLDGREWNEVPA